MKKIRFGKDIVILWQVLTEGKHTALGCRDLKLEIRNSLNRVVVLPMQVSDTSCVLKAIYHGKDHSSLGRHTLTLIENYGQCDQRIIDAPQVFALVKSTAEEDADVTKNTYDLHMGEITVGECDAPPSADVPVGDVWDEDNILEQEIRVIHNLREINNYGNVLSVPQDVTGTIATNVDLDTLRNELSESIKTEATQRMAADTALGNRITSVTTTANNNKTSLNTLETKLNTNLANLRAKDAELETAINNEATSRRNEVDSLQTSISNVGKRVSTTESKIITLQGNVSTLQSEVTNVKNDVVPKAVAEGIAQVVANAPEDLDTLKEVAEYIASDKTNADKIITDISNLKVKDSTHDTEIATLKQKNTQLTNSINVNATNIAKNTSDITANTEVLAKQAKELANKAPKVGYAPDLKVDFAKELVGRGVAEPQEIGAIRPTGLISIGDGNATIEKVKGKSVVWNQLLKLTPRNESKNGIELSINEEGVVTVNGVNTGTSSSFNIQTKISQHIGHKMMLVGSTEMRGWNEFSIYESSSGTTAVNGKGYNIFTSTKELVDINVNVWPNIAVDNVVFKPLYYDLTQMFGAGNEPTTIEEFYARKPLGVSDEYNEGEIISYDAQELKSVGFNAWDEEWENGLLDTKGLNLDSATALRSTNYIQVVPNATYMFGCPSNTGNGVAFFDADKNIISPLKPLNANTTFTTPQNCAYIRFDVSSSYGGVYKKDISIHLVHTGYRNGEYQPYEEDTLRLPDIKAIKDKDGNQLFPYGLLSAGTAHDEITATKAIKRIGVVDMGTMSWALRTDTHSAVLQTDFLRKLILEDERNNLLCDRYAIGGTTVTGAGITASSPEKTLYKHYSSGGIYNYLISLRDSAYTSADEFKQAMQGVMLYYELAEPIEVDLPEPLNLTYDAWDFGTEELVAEGATTPLNADIVYQFNAVDRIRENTAKNQALETELAELKAQLTQLTQVTNDEDSNA